MIPPPVLTPPINSKPIVDPKSIVDPKPLVDPIDQTPVIDKANLLSARDISFAPQWQSFQKSRFPQPILLIRHTTPIAESIQIDFSGGPSEIEMKNSSEGNWEVMASGRQVGNLKLVDDEQGSQLEFQCELDNSGAPTVFLDAIDQLNQCVLEIRTGNLPLTKFEVATQLIQGHIDLDNRRKHEDLAFGVGGESLTQTLAGHDVAIRLLPEISPVLSTPSPEDENQTSGPPEAGKEETDNDEATQGEMLLTK